MATYTVNGIGFDSFTKAVASASSIGADVIDSATGSRKWTPAPKASKSAWLRYANRKSAYDAQERLNAVQAARRAS